MDLHYAQGEAIFTKVNQVPRQYPYLTEDIETEVVVIGGGVTGAIVSYYMSEAGIRCTLLEKSRIAHGSTSITTSLLQYELDSNARELEQYTSLQNVVRSYKLGLKALKEIDNFIQVYGNQCEYAKRDTLLYTNKQAESAQMEEEYKVRKEAGLPVDFIGSENNPFSFELKGGVYSHEGGAQLDPYQYTHQLLEVSTQKGLKVYENTEVIKISYLAEGVELETVYGHKVKAKKVILATGYDTGRFSNRNFGTKTVTYNIATKPVSTLEGWMNKVLIRDNNDPYHYYRTTQDHRILAGGEDIPFNPGIFDEQAADERYDRLEQKIKEMFPNIPDIEKEYTYCGAFASTQDNLGFIGPDTKHQHLWYCLGYGANGILFAILGGLMLSKLYKGEKDDDLDLFRIDRFDGRGMF
ncbi:FAD-dependent oxidoreductase [Niameybacter massiliensis]|uniref:FAD-dependent oxidoreductase n=1 Tax=Holtiella tumoricola TaxID=3018743 RepID=A0AA42DKW6_9FIRM|nr:FAD-dependent oxidoreductase [Holtiella tumoricola]MDA3730987.1 FAD-dependent oxidoreductase [Holtiella tumoricola]